MKILKQTSGFTLIELIVVMAIVGILAISSQAVYTNSKMKSRDAVRQMHLVTMKSAIEQLYVVSGQYPKPLELKASLLDFSLSDLPADPQSGVADTNTRFEYVYGASYNEESYLPGQKYEVSANLEYGQETAEKAAEKTDRGNDAVRWEIGTKINTVNTDLPASGNECNTGNDYDRSDPGSGDCVVVDGL